MSVLHVFNPWNDLALASDSISYTPPPAAIDIEEKGTILLMLVTERNHFIAVPDKILEKCSLLSDRLSCACPWKGEKIDRVEPWGWSKALVTQMVNSGVDRKLMPDDKTLDRLRNLSHRRLTIEAHKHLQTNLVPVEAFTLQDCVEAYNKWGDVVGKYPWSSSGRGLFSGEAGYEESFLRRCRGAMHHQGSVMIERAFEVEMDFAMLFRSHGRDQVKFRGYSLFDNNRRAYVSNLLLSDSEIEKRVNEFIPLDRIRYVQEALSGFLSKKIGRVYDGWIGVDQFIYRDINGTYGLNPCVEINLRMTMGIISRLLLDRYPQLNGCRLSLSSVDKLTEIL